MDYDWDGGDKTEPFWKGRSIPLVNSLHNVHLPKMSKCPNDNDQLANLEHGNMVKGLCDSFMTWDRSVDLP